MSKKVLTKLKKSTAILKDSIATEWCYVDTENNFVFMNKLFNIDESLSDYKVHNKSGDVENYTNESYMEEILVTVNKSNQLKFYNQNYDKIENGMVKVVN